MIQIKEIVIILIKGLVIGLGVGYYFAGLLTFGIDRMFENER